MIWKKKKFLFYFIPYRQKLVDLQYQFRYNRERNNKNFQELEWLFGVESFGFFLVVFFFVTNQVFFFQFFNFFFSLSYNSNPNFFSLLEYFSCEAGNELDQQQEVEEEKTRESPPNTKPNKAFSFFFLINVYQVFLLFFFYYLFIFFF